MTSRSSFSAAASSTTAASPARTLPTTPNNALSLERKIELFESRFTMPAAGSDSPGTTEVPNFGNTNSPGNSMHSTTASQHSYAFSTPLSKTRQTSNHSVPSHLPSTAIRSKKKPSHSAAFQALNLATDRHMRKMAATSPFSREACDSGSGSDKLPTSLVFTDAYDQAKSFSGLPTPPVSSDASPKSTASNSTLLTSHVNRSSNSARQVVAESPPVQVTPTRMKSIPRPPPSSKPSAARNILTAGISAKRKSTPKRKLAASVADRSAPHTRMNPHNAKRTRLFADETKIRNSSSSVTEALNASSEFSRDRSNPPSQSKKAKVPANNKFISDFFSAATSQAAKKKAVSGIATDAAAAPTDRDDSMVETSEFRNEMAAKMRRMELQLREKDEQLKALANNRTILHTALESALSKAKNQLLEFQEKADKREEEAAGVIEDLLRWKSTQEAKELREKLAADGARLGRIVHARAGMRTVESWEEGQATKDILAKKKHLRSKRKLVEQKMQQAAEIDSATPSDSSATKPLATLEQLEAQEAQKMQLLTLQREERKLSEAEQALNAEKGTHIRALKRVASEDSSRFSSRPKLNDRYLLQSQLGKGGFSEVWRAFDLTKLREVAVKIHQLDPRWPDSKKENYTKHVSREYEIQRNVRHARIVSLYDIFEIDTNSFATVLECCKGTDLDTLLKERRRLPENEARTILLQILTGMQYLSQGSADGSRQGIIHYDLKPGNILFDELGFVKITDFGLSKIVDAPDPAESMELTSQGAGTYWYLPPECFVTSEKVRISNKVDVWSIGVIFFQMLFGKRPFGEGKSQDRLLSDHTMLNAQNVEFPEKSDASEEAKSFIRECLSYDQAFRPNIGQLCEHDYILKRSSPS